MGQDDQYLLPRQLDLSEITCYGFDMDYTLCEYRAPAMDSLAHTLAKEFIVNRWTAHSCLLPSLCTIVPHLLGILIFVSDILQLCRCGHAPELLQLEYEAGLGGVVRGSWLDRDTGNLLVVDSLGHILQCSHGRRSGDSFIKSFEPVL